MSRKHEEAALVTIHTTIVKQSRFFCGSGSFETFNTKPVAEKLTAERSRTFFETRLHEMQAELSRRGPALVECAIPTPPNSPTAMGITPSSLQVRFWGPLSHKVVEDPLAYEQKRHRKAVTLDPLVDREQTPIGGTEVSFKSLERDQLNTQVYVPSSTYKPAFKTNGGSILSRPVLSSRDAKNASMPRKKSKYFLPSSPGSGTCLDTLPQPSRKAAPAPRKKGKHCRPSSSGSGTRLDTLKQS